MPRAVSDETPANSLLEQDGHSEGPLEQVRPAALTSNAKDALPFDFEPLLFTPARSWARKLTRVKSKKRQPYHNRDVQCLSKEELRQL